MLQSVSFNNLRFPVTAYDGAKNNSKSDQKLGIYPLPLRPVLIIGITRIKHCAMSRRREYEIAFVGLKPGIHEYSYEIDDKFFEPFQQQDFRNCKAQVKLYLDKKNSFMLLKFEIGGNLEVVCDRCNNYLPLQLWDEFNITVKMVEDPDLLNEQEEDPDVYYISRGESHIDVANWIYEFINLSIPMHKTCSYEKMDGPHCNPAAMDVLKKLEPDVKEPKENPIWKGLERFKNLEDN
ncbi:MAG TPA: DUF177 domain-containing protein [Chitinophagaceae bacterium]|nr:DUF177 domain-containing protein [Chitinophagaceae bacterium]